ncbi:RIB43A-like with coiled-coils protein 1 [Operophtera brumata]|uniref:RIB43A-like with coiled-coils protein 1 n=1 Tax=Operophtera brumata TaxID=104452 RepID=A0A0L7L4A9_OPEBR|nr:RIB43A-like with coiled-coils protein 1 [Operophtera brumata]
MLVSKQERRRIDVEIDAYRQMYQRKEDTREFEGEDLDYEERKKVMAAQKNAWLEQQVKREAEEKMEAEWQALAKSIQRDVARQDIADQRKRKDIARQLMEENQLLALQQKEKEKYYKDVVNNNEPTDDYYSQFNTTTR